MTSISIEDREGIKRINVHGDFVFDVNKAFRAAYESLPPGRPVTVDLSGASYIDSAGLGMLLRLREHAGGTPNAVTLAGGNATIKTILNVANFQQLFRIT